VLKVHDPMPGYVTFGGIFANALEALHRGYDGETELVKLHAAAVKAGHAVQPGADYGLKLLAKYREHGIYVGEPEKRFSLHLPDRQLVPLPILGYMDLMTDTEVVEVKTTRSPASWTQARVDSEYQACMYRYAYHRLNGRKAERVRYLIFGTVTPTLTVLETYPTGDDLRLFELAAGAALNGIAAEKFDKTCGECPACMEGVEVPELVTDTGATLVFGGQP